MIDCGDYFRGQQVACLTKSVQCVRRSRAILTFMSGPQEKINPKKMIPDKRSCLCGWDMSGEHARSDFDPIALGTKTSVEFMVLNPVC